MIGSRNNRQPSVGEESSLFVPDHGTTDSLRENFDTSNQSDRSLGSKSGSYRHSTGSVEASKNNIAISRYSMSHMDRLDPSQTSLIGINKPKGLGESGTFRSAAEARRLMSASRRTGLREKRAQSTRNFSADLDPTEETPIVSNGTGDQPKYETAEALKSIVFGKPVSVLLLLIPLAIWSHYGGWSANYIFWLNFCVMIPLASILGDFTEEAALHTNETVGGLLNATFGNAVEVVVAIQALLANEIRVVQASMIGSIFSNLLLVLGCCFFFGGLYYREQEFNTTAATANMGLLALSSIALVLPTPFAEYYNVQDEHVLIISRFAAVFLLFMYIQLLVFQLHTHKNMFDKKEGEEELDYQAIKEGDEEEAEEEEEASISMTTALIGLAITTLSVTIFSDYLVASIDEFCKTSGVSRTFVGLIILPIVGNAVEHITAVTVAMKNKMDLSMGGTLPIT